jgi:hypothetical protein
VPQPLRTYLPTLPWADMYMASWRMPKAGDAEPGKALEQFEGYKVVSMFVS